MGHEMGGVCTCKWMTYLHVSKIQRRSEKVGHDFHRMQVKILCAIGKVVFLLTQLVDLGCRGVH